MYSKITHASTGRELLTTTTSQDSIYTSYYPTTLLVFFFFLLLFFPPPSSLPPPILTAWRRTDGKKKKIYIKNSIPIPYTIRQPLHVLSHITIIVIVIIFYEKRYHTDDATRVRNRMRTPRVSLGSKSGKKKKKMFARKINK